MIVSRRRLAETITRQLLAGHDQAELVRQVAAYLVQHRRLHELEALMSDVARELARHDGAVPATVTSARPLTDEIRKQVIATAKSMTQSTRIELDEQTDPSLIGGIILEMPGARLDASVANRLKQLKVMEK